MTTIWKYLLEVTDKQVIEMPTGAQILTVQMQYGHPCIWALVNPDAEKEERIILTFGTGHPADVEACRYIGTYQEFGGSLIFHVFEVI